jgi:hypothetical protein
MSEGAITVTIRSGDCWVTIRANSIDDAVRIIENYPAPTPFKIEGETS